jgi:hypothetical protein
MKNTEDTRATPQPREEVKKRRVSRLAIFLIVVGLIAAAFGAGALLVFLRLRSAEDAWRQERSTLEADLASQTAEAAVVKSRETLWRLYDGITNLYIELSDKNFGLAQSEITALRTTLAEAPAELDADTKAKLETILADVEQGAAALNPDAKSKAREARELLRKIVSE